MYIYDRLFSEYNPPISQVLLTRDVVEDENRCERSGKCPTLDFWMGLYDVVNRYIDGFTLADLLEEEPPA